MNTQNIFNKAKLMPAALLANNNLTNTWIMESYLQEIQNSRPNKAIVILITISQFDLERLTKKKDLFINNIKNKMSLTTKLVIDFEGNSDSLHDNEDVNLKELAVRITSQKGSNSQSNYICYILGLEHVETVFQGVTLDEGKINPFHTTKQSMEYSRRPTIDEIDTILENYRNFCLNQFSPKRLFFCNNASFKHALINRPENTLRDHFHEFLHNTTQHSFQKETQSIDSRGRYDLITYYNSRAYIFEIKWVGESIDRTGTKISSIFGKKEIEDGIVQILEYIKVFLSSDKPPIQSSFLIIFDAQPNKNIEDSIESDFNKFNFINDESLRGYLSLIKIPKPIKLKNS